MGEARQRGKRHRRIFEDQPNCIYCGGGITATTVDHIPPTSFFRSGQRPKGLEFSSCGPCNHGARLADLVIAIVGRCWPDSATADEAAHFRSLLAIANRKLPGILEEMQPSRAAEKRTIRELDLPPDVGLMRLSGPIVSSHMQAFAVRLALALHYDHTGQIIGLGGGVAVRLYSNVDAIVGDLPEFDFLDSPKTLMQGKMSAADTFLYSIKSLADKSKSIAYCTFRESFAAAMITSQDYSFLYNNAAGLSPVFRPGMLAGNIPQSYRMSAHTAGA
jgi:hypothetical protein